MANVTTETQNPKKKSKQQHSKRCSTNERCSANARCSTNDQNSNAIDFLSATQKALTKRFMTHSGIVNAFEKRMIEENVSFAFNTRTGEKTSIACGSSTK